MAFWGAANATWDAGKAFSGVAKGSCDGRDAFRAAKTPGGARSVSHARPSGIAEGYCVTMWPVPKAAVRRRITWSTSM